MRRCEVAGCGREHKARGYCNTHWMRWRKHGDPLDDALIDGGHLPPFVSGHPVVGIAAGLLLFLGKPGSQSRFSGVLTALARRPCTHGNQWQIG